MNTVIEFPRIRIGAGPRTEQDVPAEIVIFPGVRIERPAFSLSDRLSPRTKRNSSSARTMELEDI
jgi:hypothetical protein